MIGDGSSQRTQEQRRADREPLDAEVRMRIETESLRGVSDNLSDVGIMFFTDEPIRCTIEVGHGPEARRYAGRVVRLQRMNDTNTGLAIEFEAR